MGMLPTPEDPQDLRTPAFIRRMLGMDEPDAHDEPEDPIVVTQPEPEPLPDITPEDDEDAPAISDTEPQAAQPERPESRAARKRRRAVRRVSRRHVPETEPAAEPQAAPLALPASPAPPWSPWRPSHRKRPRRTSPAPFPCLPRLFRPSPIAA